MEFKGAVFDLDGVITDTAKVHAKAWKEMFDEFLKKHSKKNFVPFDIQSDYLKYVDGKPRAKGAGDFFKSRKINLSLGKPTDPPSKNTIWGLSNKKNKIFLSLLEKNKPEVYDSTVSLIKNLRSRKIKVGVISSSKNCKKILRISQLLSLFDTIVDGKVSEKIGLLGKPNPDIFLHAAKELNVNPEDCIVFEDAFSGIEAGRKGNFGLVVGISRNHNPNLKHADTIVKDLKELDIKKLNKLFVKELEKKNGDLKYYYFLPERERLREALTTVGNGYIGTRGCFETQSASENHYPGCYIAGVYNTLKTKIDGKYSVNNSLVNCPNWLLMKIKIGDEFINPFEQEIIEYEKKLDLKRAFLYHKIVFKDKKKRITKITSKRFSSMKNPHLSSIIFNLTPVNYSEKISIQSLIDGNIRNKNVARYSKLKSKHLKTISSEKEGKILTLHSRTINSHYDIVMSVKNITKSKKSKKVESENLIGEEFVYQPKQKQEISIEKIVSIFTSRESKQPKNDSINLLKRTKDFSSGFDKHSQKWNSIWNKSDIVIKGDRFSQDIARLHIYHLLSSYSPNVIGLDVGVLARGLTGEAYRGHIFWDEIYIMPFYVHRFPEVAKAHIMYRCRRLKQAKEYAKKQEFKGAIYPQQSADTGEEESPDIHYNPKGRKWGPDLSKYQRHVSIAIFYNFYKYFKHTEDREFFEKYGAETMVEIARFWADIAKYDEKDKKYHIEGVMGPDEFHEKYSGSKKPGLKDNAYTNVMVSWLLREMVLLEKTLPDNKKKKLGITEKEVYLWEDISNKINVVVKNNIIMQFKDFDKLKEINFSKYKKKYGNIERIDRILKSEGKFPDNYKAIKQPDVLMIFYLLSFEDAIKILRNLGIEIKNQKEFIQKNYDYYLKITTHGSTLSRFIHDAISSNLKEKKDSVWTWFRKALESDIYDSQNGTTSEGVHSGLMAGTLEIIRKYFAGIKTHELGITIKPWMPTHWKKLKLKIIHKGKEYYFEYLTKKKKLKVSLIKGNKSFVFYREKNYVLKRGKTRIINLKDFTF